MPRKAALSMEDAFLQAILERPDDDLPRLVFADWLEEQGNPRGTFIRLQCQRAKLTQYDPEWKELLAQESTLLKQFEAEWSKSVLRWVDQVEYRRGFIEHVRVSATKLLKNGYRLFQAAPVCSVRLERPDRLADLGACAWLARVTELDLNRQLLGGKSLQALLQSEHCQSLRVLRLDRCTLLDQSIQFLANAPTLRSLRTLSLAGNSVGPCSVLFLSRSAHFGELRELRLSDNHLGVEGAIALCSQPMFRLTSLDLGSNDLGNDGAAALARCPQLAELRRLDLQSNAVGNLGVEALLRSPHMLNLEHLNLYHNHVSSRGVQLLTGSTVAAHLSFLDLRSNEIDKATLATVRNRLDSPKLRELLV